MSGVLLSMAANRAPQSDGGETFETPLGRYMRGTRFQLRWRDVVATVNGTTDAAGTRWWEGPFIRIRPHQWDAAGKTFSARTWKIGEVGNTPNGTVTADGTLTYFYECDANQNVPIYLPFEASLTLYSTMCMRAAYDIFYNDTGAEGSDPKVDMRDDNQELSLTRNVKGGQTRDVRVPLGCQEYSIVGQNPTGIGLNYDPTAKVAGTQTPQVFTAPGLRRYATAGAATITIDATTVDVAKSTGVVFWVRLR